MNRFGNKRGMTMIELVSALMLFIFILGGLVLALNKATNLWSSSHTRQNEQETSDLVLRMLSDDLRQAVSDNGRPLDDNSKIKPAFLCDSTTNQTDQLKMLLQFVRHRPAVSPFNAHFEDPPFLDAVFYTFYANMLFRHVVPLEEYSSDERPAALGELLERRYTELNSAPLHDSIITYLQNPDPSSQPSHPGSFSLIASRIQQPLIFGTISEELVTEDANSDPPVLNARIDSIPITTPEVYLRFATTALPDFLDIEIRIFSESDWNSYQNLINNATPEQFEKKAPYLGAYHSKRIYMPTARGARLP